MYRELRQKTIIDLLNKEIKKENNHLFDYQEYRLLNELYFQDYDRYQYDIANNFQLKNRIKYYYLVNFKIIITDHSYDLLIAKVKKDPYYLDSINDKDPEYVAFNKKYPFYYLLIYATQCRSKEIWTLLEVGLKETKKGAVYLDLKKYPKIRIKLPNKKKNMVFEVI